MVTFYTYKNKQGEVIPTRGTVAPFFPVYGFREDGGLYIKDWFTYDEAFTVPDVEVAVDELYILSSDHESWQRFSEAYPVLKEAKALERMSDLS